MPINLVSYYYPWKYTLLVSSDERGVKVCTQLVWSGQADSGIFHACEPCGILADGSVVFGCATGDTPEKARALAAMGGHRNLWHSMHGVWLKVSDEVYAVAFPWLQPAGGDDDGTKDLG